MEYRIITHDGKAHMDELIASALLALKMGEMPTSVERIDSQEAARIVSAGESCENDYYIDCGLLHNEKLGFYDHHQEREMESAALLVFNHLYPELKGSDLHEYMKLISRVDTKGPMDLEGFSRDQESSDYLNQNQRLLLTCFEMEPQTIIRLVSLALADKIQFEEDRKVAALWLKEEGNISVEEIDGIKVLFYLIPPPPELSSPLKAETTVIIDEQQIDATCGYDSKDHSIRSLYRTDYGHKRLDFTNSTPSNPLFVHQGGFFMKFSPDCETEWNRLVRESIL